MLEECSGGCKYAEKANGEMWKSSESSVYEGNAGAGGGSVCVCPSCQAKAQNLKVPYYAH